MTKLEGIWFKKRCNEKIVIEIRRLDWQWRADLQNSVDSYENCARTLMITLINKIISYSSIKITPRMQLIRPLVKLAPICQKTSIQNLSTSFQKYKKKSKFTACLLVLSLFCRLWADARKEPNITLLTTVIRLHSLRFKRCSFCWTKTFNLIKVFLWILELINF